MLDSDGVGSAMKSLEGWASGVGRSRFAGQVGLLTVVALACACAPISTTKAPSNSEVVVLLHGLGRGAEAMNYLSTHLENDGFQSCSVEYPSRAVSLDELAAFVHGPIEACLGRSHRRVHFVAHSMGGIVTRGYLQEHRPEKMGRVVLIATPNGGTELVDLISRNPSLAAALGPAAMGLGTGAEDLPRRLPDPDFELGIIAGNVSYNPVSSTVLPGPDDGYVSVESAKLEGMSDFLVVPTSHALLRFDPRVASEVVYFLRFGRFAHLQEHVPLSTN